MFQDGSLWSDSAKNGKNGVEVRLKSATLKIIFFSRKFYNNEFYFFTSLLADNHTLHTNMQLMIHRNIILIYAFGRCMKLQSFTVATTDINSVSANTHTHAPVHTLLAIHQNGRNLINVENFLPFYNLLLNCD